MTGANTVKGRTLRRDPRAALTVDLEEPPYAFVTVQGSVEISEDLEEMLPLSIAIARRYVERVRGRGVRPAQRRRGRAADAAAAGQDHRGRRPDAG